jgi:OmpA-OmpF porin, OOP family
MKLWMRFLLFSVCFCATTLRAQDENKPQDADGCKDSPLVTRFPGSHIDSCDKKEFDEMEIPVAKDKNGNEVTKKLEGEVQTWTYVTREGTSNLQLFRNFENALRQSGFTIDFEDKPERITAHKSNAWLFIYDRDTAYDQKTVTTKEMKQEVTADASSLSEEISKNGHVSVYGIHFDTGKAAILPDSESILSEIVKLLQQNPTLKLRVEGHTDDQGNAAANQALSEKRSQAVVAWLTAHDISAARLSAKGLGQTKPVADNASEDGRAKNRRVELVRQD